MPLTDSAIKTAKPKDKLYRLADSNGLCLEVAPTGSKLWRYRYRFNGKAKMLSLGAYPAVPLAAARRKRDDARLLLDEGTDPGAERQATKQAQALETQTFEELAREWHAYRSPRWAKSTADKAAAYLESDLLPALGHRPVKAITRPELVALIRKIESRGAHNVAKKTRQWLSQIFRFGLAQGSVEANPATDLDVIAAHAPATRHHPHVTCAELPELLSKIEAANINTLTRHAVAILRQLQEVTGGYALVFAGRNNTNRPMSENTINKALADAGYKDRQTGHGFRHLLSTELNGRGYNRDWIERQLAHGDDDEMRDTYNHAAYLEQRREMMQAWADSVDALCAGANVVSIKRKA